MVGEIKENQVRDILKEGSKERERFRRGSPQRLVRLLLFLQCEGLGLGADGGVAAGGLWFPVPLPTPPAPH